jgi:D-galactarolactone cycloisomerase
MEIASVEAIPIRRELEEPFANAQKWIRSREYCLVRATGDDGTVGWGECWGPVAGNREVVETFLGPRLVGRRVQDVEAIHGDLRFDLRSAYHSHVPVGALSGVDIALWDLYGKALDVPVADLLGGRRRSAVPAYATGHFWPEADSFDAIRAAVVEEAVGHVEAGFGALKNKIGLYRHPDFPYGWREDVELVRAIREAVGDDVLLATDANHAYDRATAERVGHRLADLDVHFFEEPVEPRHVDDYVRLNAALEVPLAGGECWAFEEGFADVLTRGGVAYAQPDVTSAGGLTSTRRIAALAAANNVQCLPHVFGSAVALAASLQVLATLPGEPMLEFDRTPNPIRDDLAVDPVELDGTEVPIPDRPGIGVAVDADVLDEFRID